jgi:hypothetical protein
VKRLFTVTVVGFAWLMAAVPAAADGPTRVPVPFGPPMVVPVCMPAFEVLVAATTDNEVSKDFYENGQLVKVITTGSLKLTLTNLTSGKTISENVSGPGFATINPDGSVTVIVTGLSLGQLGDLATSGRIVFDIAPDGTVTLASPVHHSTSICAALS